MTGLALAMDVAAVGFFAWFVVLRTRGRTVPASDGGGQSVASLLIAVSLALLSVSLWSIP
ncbi:hypothetical protein [Actinomadura sp. 3N508]|uniref:hypothetical protein n=1 Tax=Actinomadura sp. 3N508 TaxID=3375153 RepID=UPI0037914555